MSFASVSETCSRLRVVVMDFAGFRVVMMVVSSDEKMNKSIKIRRLFNPRRAVTS